MIAPQIFLEHFGVVVDEVIRHLEDALRGAVVLLQLDDAQVGVIVAQLVQVRDARAAPCVNGLIVIAHHGECGTAARQQLDHLVLAIVGVLIFVDQQIAQLLLPAQQGFGMFLEQLHRQMNQVVEIHRLISAQCFLIA